jgi:hypothetical protein
MFPHRYGSGEITSWRAGSIGVDLVALVPALAVAYGVVLGGVALIAGRQRRCRYRRRDGVSPAGIALPEAGSWVR